MNDHHKCFREKYTFLEKSKYQKNAWFGQKTPINVKYSELKILGRPLPIFLLQV